MRIALVAHDNKKSDLVEWARANRTTLSHHTLLATSSTGEVLEAELETPVDRMHSGPLGGDLQLGRKSPRATSTYCSSSGIHWSRNLMTPM